MIQDVQLRLAETLALAVRAGGTSAGATLGWEHRGTGNSDTANRKWSFSESKQIGQVTDFTPKYWRADPANFTKAAQAAGHYARTQNRSMMIVSGNSYGNKIFHIVGADEDGPGQAGQFGNESTVAIVHPNGGVHQVKATKKLK